MSLLLFPGLPGGPELLVVLVLMVALFGVPLVVVVLGWQYVRGDRQRVEELEETVRELETELQAERDADEADSDGRDAEPDDGR